MPVSSSPIRWNQPLNPGDKVDFALPLAGLMLESNESIANYTLTLSPASIAAGLVLGSGNWAPQQPSATSLLFWFSIDPAHQADTTFDGVGTWLDMQLVITTNNIPARTRERTLLLQVCRQ